MTDAPVAAPEASAGIRRAAWGRAAWAALTVLGVVGFPYLVWISHGSFGYDARAYWQVNLGALYAGTAGNLDQLGAFRYAPPIAVLFSPFSLLSWSVFLTVWTAFLIACIALLGGLRNTLAIAGFPPVAMELHYGNVNLPIAVCAAYGFAYPGLWAFVLLTKPTCAVGLLWFAVRRDWRALAWALGITAAAVIPTMVLRPDLWSAYVAMLTSDSGVPQVLPLALRVPAAALLVAWGALTNRPWTVPAAAALAVPKIAWPTLAILAGAVPLLVSRAYPPLPGLVPRRWRPGYLRATSDAPGAA